MVRMTKKNTIINLLCQRNAKKKLKSIPINVQTL